MTADEYKNEVANIKRMWRELNEKYIAANTPVNAPNLVMIDGEVLWLKGYVIVQDTISPTLYKVNEHLKPKLQIGKVYRRNWREMKPYGCL